MNKESMINELSDLLAEEADRVEPSFQRMAEIMYEKGYRKHQIEAEMPKEIPKTSGIRVVIEDLKIVEKKVFSIGILPVPWKVGIIYSNKNSRVTKSGNKQKVNMGPNEQSEDFKKSFASQASRWKPTSSSPLLKLPIFLCFDFNLPRSKKSSGLSDLPLEDPDLTNLQKLAEDALSKLFWNNDNQVINVCNSKRFVKPEGEQPSITTYIYYVEKE